MKVEDVLGGAKKGPSSESSGAYPSMDDSPARSYRDELMNDLSEALSISPSKADRLATVICALAREEMSGSGEEEEEAPSEKPRGVALVLGSKKPSSMGE
jgi:hypothetical protein